MTLRSPTSLILAAFCALARIAASLAAAQRPAATQAPERPVSLLFTQSATHGSLSIPHVSLTSAAFSYDGRRLVTAANDQTIRVWDIKSRRQDLTLRGQDGTVETTEFSPNGNWILAAGASDGTVRVWNAHRGEESIVLDRRVYSAATFGPDGRRVLAAGGDVRLIECTICAPLDDVVRVATRRSTRRLTAAERATFLP